MKKQFHVLFNSCIFSLLSLGSFRKNHSNLIIKRRAVSEVISTILLLGITVAGAAMVSLYIQDSDISDVTAMSPTIGSSGTSASSIKLVGYDTRDTRTGEGLSGIVTLENLFVAPGQLCTGGCDAPLVVNKIPILGGTEFITLQIKNRGLESVTVQSITINSISHPWDPLQNGVCLHVSVGGTYPADGKFSVVYDDDTCVDSKSRQRNTNILLSNEEFLLVIKLSSSIPGTPDLDLNTPLRIKINTDKFDLQNHLIVVGSLK